MQHTTVKMKQIIKLNLARNCLKYLIRKYGIKEIFIPYYSCDTLWKAAQEEHCKIRFYHINDKFYPDKEFNKDDYIIYINYFGLCTDNAQKLSKKYPHLILDNTQSYYSSPLGFACFNSLRKFFKVQNGAYLYCNSHISPNFDEDITKLTPVYIHENYNKFVENELLLNNEPIKTISKDVKNFMANVNMQKDKTERIKIFKYYEKYFEKYNLLKLKLERNEIPYCYPFSTNNDEILTKLSHFTLLRLWKKIPKTFPEYEFLNNTIALPLYDYEYCKKICEIFTQKNNS